MFITTRPRHKLFISARRLVGEAVVKLQLVQTNMKVNQKMLPQQVRSREINTTELIHQCPSSGWQQTQPHAVSGGNQWQCLPLWMGQVWRSSIASCWNNGQWLGLQSSFLGTSQVLETTKLVNVYLAAPEELLIQGLTSW